MLEKSHKSDIVRFWWQFFDYVEGGQNPIQTWYSGDLSEAGRMQFDVTLKNTAKIEHAIQWGGFKHLQGESKKHKIWQLDFVADRKQYRLLGVFRPGREAILLIGCYHKGKIYVPPSALETACTRAIKLAQNAAGKHERKINLSI